MSINCENRLRNYVILNFIRAKGVTHTNAWGETGHCLCKERQCLA
jgi:hypothetical protein